MLNQGQPSELDTTLPVHTRADSNEAPRSVIHAPQHIKTFVGVVYIALHCIGADESCRIASLSQQADIIPKYQTLAESWAKHQHAPIAIFCLALMRVQACKLIGSHA